MPRVSLNTIPAPPTLTRNLAATLMFYCFCVLANLIAFYIPDYKPEGTRIHQYYDRGLVYKSDYLPLSNLVTFALLMVAGYFYLTTIVIGRKTPFLS